MNNVIIELFTLALMVIAVRSIQFEPKSETVAIRVRINDAKKRS